MKPHATWYAYVATAVFLAGWATGGLVFGVLGDRIGRARTMLLTILLYSLCTGLSALSVNITKDGSTIFFTNDLSQASGSFNRTKQPINGLRHSIA